MLYSVGINNHTPNFGDGNVPRTMIKHFQLDNKLQQPFQCAVITFERGVKTDFDCRFNFWNAPNALPSSHGYLPVKHFG